MKYLSTRLRSWIIYIAVLSTLALFAGCASYQPRPLESRSPLVLDLQSLRAGITAVQDSGIAGGYDINFADGFDLTEIGILAVINNPDLIKQRAKWQVAGAQAFAAGLLPDPQISAGLDRPAGNTAGLVDGGLLDLGYDIIPLITRQARVDSARNREEKVRLDLLWQEWQVIEQARSMAVRLKLETERLALLKKMRSLYQERYRRSARALREGDITLDVNGTDLTALVDTLSQINQLEQTHNQTEHDLNLLLGLKPHVPITISPLPVAKPLSSEMANKRLALLPGLRPDLLALRAGYESQEARVRAAILAQFPSFGISINRARDTGDVYTNGLSISLILPLFSGNRGNIAIERATRKQLREEYRGRLAQAQIDVDRLLTLQTILREQQENLQIYLPPLKKLVARARRTYRRGDIGALTFLNMESTWVNKRLEQINLEQAAWENRIALEALLALPSYPDKPLRVTSENLDTTP